VQGSTDLPEWLSYLNEALDLGGDALEVGALAGVAVDSSAAPEQSVAEEYGLFKSRALVAPKRLKAAPAARLAVHKMQLAPFPHRDLLSVLRGPLEWDQKAVMGPLAVNSTRLRPDGRLSLVAGGLDRSARVAELIVDGPHYHALRLMRTRDGGGAAVITLPRKLAGGRWTIAVEDLSQLELDKQTDTLDGMPIFRVGIFSVP
jgi:hypothetical protein